MREPKWLSARTLLALHQMHLAHYGGDERVRSRGLVELALTRPQQVYYSGREVSLPRLAAAYVFAIAPERPFEDGNRRTSLLAAALFLEKNGLRFQAPETEAVTAIRLVESGEWTEERLGEWLLRNSAK
jgi:death-on-curing protein